MPLVQDDLGREVLGRAWLGFGLGFGLGLGLGLGLGFGLGLGLRYVTALSMYWKTVVPTEVTAKSLSMCSRSKRP